MAEGKYFLIRSKLNPDLALDVEGCGSDPGTRVITFEAHGAENQLWYHDPLTGTIRSKLNNMCLDLIDNRLVLNNYNAGDPNQQWETSGDHIVNRQDPNKMLDIVAGNSSSGAEVCSWEEHGGDNQKWTFEHKGATFFYIESVLSGKVMDITQGDPSPGSKVIMWSRKDAPEDNQLWYEDRHGIIRSKLNDLVLDASRGPLEMDHFNPGESRQWWLIKDQTIVNRENPSEVLDICAASTDDGAEIIPYQFHGGDNQLWKVDPVAL